MPIRPENRSRYPKDWPAISAAIRFERAGGRCECAGECGRDHGGRCANRHLQPSVSTGKRVVLTVAHLDHAPENCEASNLLACCQSCHNRYDAAHRAETRAWVRNGCPPVQLELSMEGRGWSR